jgi:hypothetical protein
MLYSKSVSIPYPPVLDTSAITRVKVRHVQFDINDLNPEFTEYLKKLNLHVSFAEIFYTTPNITSGIHIDVRHGDISKLNYIYGGAGSQMCWYNPISSTIGEQKITAVDSKYIAFTSEQVTLAYTDSLIEPSVVQVGAPHNVVNGNHDRHCLSMVIIENKRRVSMSRAAEIFSSVQ